MTPEQIAKEIAEAIDDFVFLGKERECEDEILRVLQPHFARLAKLERQVAMCRKIKPVSCVRKMRRLVRCPLCLGMGDTKDGITHKDDCPNKGGDA